MRMALTGQPICAEDARVAGLISDLVEDDQVQAHALELARVIASMPALAAEQIKEVILAGMERWKRIGLALFNAAAFVIAPFVPVVGELMLLQMAGDR